MNQFVIDEFDFGVDATRSSLQTANGLLTLKIVGDESIVEMLNKSDPHPWEWVIQPPFLYVIELPYECDENGDFEYELTDQDLDDYDIALYLIEHNDVLPCRIVKKGKVLTVTGLVHHIRKTPLKFCIELNLP